MERFSNRFGVLALHALVWTLPVGLFVILILTALAPTIRPEFFSLFKQPSVGQRFYFQVAMSTIALLYFGLCTAGGTVRLPRNGVLGAAILYGLCVTASSLAARSPLFTIKETAFLWCGILLLGMVTHLRLSRRQSRALLTSLVLIAAVSALYGLLQYFGVDLRWGAAGYPADIEEARFHVLGLQGHPNYLTAFIGPALLLCPGLIAASSSVRWRAVLGGVMVVIALCILVSGTRSAWLGTLFMGGGMAVVAMRKYGSFRLGRRGKIAAVVAACGLVLLVMQARHRYSFLDRLAEARPVQGRLYFYVVATRMIAQHPLLGIGYNNYGVQFWDYSDALQSNPANHVYSFILEDVGGIRADQAHDEYLQIAAETGMVGLGVFFFLMVVYFRRVREEYQRLEARHDRLLLLGMAGAVGFLLMDCLFSFPLRLPCSSLALWLVMGIGSRYAWPEAVAAAPEAANRAAASRKGGSKSKASAKSPAG